MKTALNIAQLISLNFSGTFFLVQRLTFIFSERLSREMTQK